MWGLPLCVAMAVMYQPERVSLGVKALLPVALVWLAARLPGRWLLVLVAVLPFQQFLIAARFRTGLPSEIARDLGFWKELVVLGCGIAAVRQFRDSGKKLDHVDVLGLTYVGIVALYYLVPDLFIHPIETLGTSTPVEAAAVVVALRNSTSFVILLLAARHLGLDAPYRACFVRTLFVAGVVVAALGIFEVVWSEGWNRLVVDWLQVPRYKDLVLDISSPNPLDVRVYTEVAGRDVLRIGSVFLDQLACGFYLVAALAVGVERLARTLERPWVYVATSFIGLALLFTQTRAALLAGFIAVLSTLRRSSGSSTAARVRFTLLVAAGLVVTVPVALGTGLAQRASEVVSGGEESTEVHVARTTGAVASLVNQPLGRGLGTGSTTANRFEVDRSLASENYYLHVGNETGALSMAFFAGLVVSVLRRLRRLGHESGPDLLAMGCRSAFLGLSVAALLLDVWIDIAVAWTVWAGVGLSVAASDRSDSRSLGRQYTAQLPAR
ncbi:hypothetical protein BH18ACT4_BH18ACT4_01500 [soil metagenome]